MRNTVVYGAAGTASSVALGYLLGAFGEWAGTASRHGLLPTTGLVLMSLALARMAGARIPLPQIRRVSDRRWAMRLPSAVASALWGLDIGLFATTRISLLGAWLVPVSCIALGDPWSAAALFVTYWLGRLASTVAAPMFVRRTDAVALLAEIDAQQQAFRFSYAVGLLQATVVFTLMALS